MAAGRVHGVITWLRNVFAKCFIGAELCMPNLSCCKFEDKSKIKIMEKILKCWRALYPPTWLRCTRLHDMLTAVIHSRHRLNLGNAVAICSHCR